MMGPSRDARGFRAALSPARRGSRLALAAATCCLAMLALAQVASAQVTTYTAVQSLAVPPASNYAGSAGGDGWAVALSSTQVFNVFHHDGILQFACHNQADATPCYPVQTITDNNGNNFASSSQVGLHLDPNTGFLYVYATRTSDGTGGVVCIDTAGAQSNPDPYFCGFTPLTAVGDAPTYNGISSISDPMQVGNDWYAFNSVPGAQETGTENEILCFDLTADAACQNQPFALNLPPGVNDDNGYPGPSPAAVGNELLIPVTINGIDTLACFNGATQSDCGGSFPLQPGFGFATEGAPFPLLDASGTVQGFCLQGSDACFDPTGASVSTPPNMSSTIFSNQDWTGQAVVLGPRVYLVDFNTQSVECYDYSTDASCANFPYFLQNLGNVYTVNVDPQRPACLWVNSDNGSAQIQNFDAYSTGSCGNGQIRVLASQFVVPQQACYPASYVKLQLLQPDPSSYTSGTVTFEDSDGNPLQGISPLAIDGNGAVDLTSLNLDQNGLPQFLITLNGETGTPTQVEVELVWTATYDPSCVGPNTGTAQAATTTTTMLTAGGQSSDDLTVAPGTAVTDQASVSGPNGDGAGGRITYNVYSDPNCSQLASSQSPQSFIDDDVPASSAVTLNTPGTYYWQAVYSGDDSNYGSSSTCGSEIETVTGASNPQYSSVTPLLVGGGQSAQAIVVPSGTSVYDSGTLSGVNSSTAGGTLTYNAFYDPGCTVNAVSSDVVSVTNGSIPNSVAQTLPEGTYWWTVNYSGDANNDPYASVCGWQTEVVLSSAKHGADIGTLLNAYPSSTLQAGTAFEADVVVTNYGPNAAGKVLAGVQVPKGLSVIDAGGATTLGRLLLWKLGTMPVGQTITYHIWLAASATGTSNLAAGALSLATLDSKYSNNFASESLTFNGPRHLSARHTRANGSALLARLRALGHGAKQAHIARH